MTCHHGGFIDMYSSDDCSTFCNWIDTDTGVNRALGSDVQLIFPVMNPTSLQYLDL